MSRTRKFIGLWIILLMFGVVLPGAYYLLIGWLDSVFNFGVYMAAGMGIMLAAAAVLIGAFWVFWAYSYLHFVGGGSPVEAFGRALYPTQKLVTTGPYAYTRNPMEFGLLFILLSIAFYTRSFSGLILLPVFAITMIVYLVIFEEPQLVHRFGQEYDEYRRSVPLLLPSIRLRRSS
ncbi:MAG: methyltransferase family protein [Armatimonadota bacterium]